MDVRHEIAQHGDGHGDGPNDVLLVLPDSEIDVLSPQLLTLCLTAVDTVRRGNGWRQDRDVTQGADHQQTHYAR